MKKWQCYYLSERQDYLSVISLVREVLIWCELEDLHEVIFIFFSLRLE